MTRSSSAQSAHSAASARGVASVDSMMDVDDGLGTDVGPAASKKSREAGPEREESSPPQVTRAVQTAGSKKGVMSIQLLAKL